MDLCKMLISCDIPLHKLNHEKFNNFFIKHFKTYLPDESTLRKNYLPKLYEKTMNEIKSKLINEKIWVAIDETHDDTGRSIANVIAGPMKKEPSNYFLLACEVLEKTNHSSISQLFNKAMIFLYEQDIKYENVMLLITDAARYMVKAGNIIKGSYPKLIHLTCLAHGLNHVAEEIRLKYSKVNKLISNVKKIYTKAPLRISIFKQKAPNISLPPQPVITRWGTWIEASIYYSKNYNLIKNLVEDLDDEDTISIQNAKNLFKSNDLKANLVFISANFSGLTSTIKQLEERNLKLNKSINLIEEQFEVFKNLGDQTLFGKFKDVLDKNNGFKQIKLINSILNGQDLIDQLAIDYSPEELAAFSFAPLTSVDVERSFSVYKSLFTNKRHHFNFENLKMVYMINCNSKNLE